MAADSSMGFHHGVMPSSSLQSRHMLSFQSGSMMNSTVGMAGPVNIGSYSGQIEGSAGNGVYFTGGPSMVNCSVAEAGPSSLSNSGFDPFARLKLQQQQQGSGLTPEWTPEEHNRLTQGLIQYATEDSMMKYIKIAAMLPRKTVRDVAMRCQWLKQESNKRRKLEEYYAAKRMNMKMNLHMVNPINSASFVPMMHQVNQNDLFSCEGPMLDGATQQLMEENIRMLHQISTNLSTYKVQENIDLFCHTRNNFTSILNNMSNTPGIMSQMPPLPVLANEQLLNVILHGSNQAFMFGGAGIHSDQQQIKREDLSKRTQEI